MRDRARDRGFPCRVCHFKASPATLEARRCERVSLYEGCRRSRGGGVARPKETKSGYPHFLFSLPHYKAKRTKANPKMRPPPGDLWDLKNYQPFEVFLWRGRDRHKKVPKLKNPGVLHTSMSARALQLGLKPCRRHPLEASSRFWLLATGPRNSRLPSGSF